MFLCAWYLCANSVYTGFVAQHSPSMHAVLSGGQLWHITQHACQRLSSDAKLNGCLHPAALLIPACSDGSGSAEAASPSAVALLCAALGLLPALPVLHL